MRRAVCRQAGCGQDSAVTDDIRRGFQKHAGTEQRPPGSRCGPRAECEVTLSSHPRPPRHNPTRPPNPLSETKVLTMTWARPLCLCSRPPVGSAMFLDRGRGEVQDGGEPGPTADPIPPSPARASISCVSLLDLKLETHQ